MRRNRLFHFVICLAMLFSLATPAYAAQSQTITVDPINVMVGGKVFLPTDVNGKNVPIFVYNGTTYAPLRALAEAYGLTVGYNAEKKLATVDGIPSGDFVGTKGTAQALTKRTALSVSPINIEVNSKVFQPKDVNGKNVSVFVYNGTTYAPLRALAEAYGLTVGYNSEKRLATVDFVSASDADLTEFFEEVNTAHKAQVTNTAIFSDISDYIVSDTSVAGLLSAEEVRSLTTQRNIKNTLTAAEAAADIDVFFRAFASAYGGYYYFGEDAWAQAEAEVTTWLRGRSSVTAGELETALADAMDFLQDAHVGIGSVDRGLDLEYEYFYCENQDYRADGTGYYKVIDGAKWYFTAFSDSRVRMERSLTAEGELVWSPILLCPIPELKNSTVTLKNAAGEVRAETLSWIRNESYWNGYYNGGPDFQLVEESGISYLSLRSCDNYFYEELQNYAASGRDLQDASLIVFDLRGNGGGSELYSMDWLTNFVGYSPSLPLAGGTRYSTLRTATGFDDGRVAPGTFEAYQQRGRWIANDIPIVVLVDEYVASAGESTLNYLRSMENVIVVGSNTTGAQLCGNVMDLFLPNSGMMFRFGSGIGFQYDTANKDFRGYEPDIWCSPKTALDAVMQMAKRYDLASDSAVSGAGDSIKDVVTEQTDIVLYLVMDPNTGAFHQPDPELYPGERCGMPVLDGSQIWAVYKDGVYRDDFTVTSANPDIAKVTVYDFEGGTFFEIRTMDWGICEFYVTVDGETAKFTYTSVG